MVDLQGENRSSQPKDEEMWIANSLHEGGVPLQVLFEHYDSIYRDRVRTRLL
jgi:hypothetical protein